jgi:hypothetical protein
VPWDPGHPALPASFEESQLTALPLDASRQECLAKRPDLVVTG